MHRKSTDRQRYAVRFCEKWLRIKFNGDIDNFDECSVFISQHLESAKFIAMEIAAEYSVDSY